MLAHEFEHKSRVCNIGMVGFEEHIQRLSNWRRLTEEVVEATPPQPGVYVIRTAGGTPFGRLRGQSDILYIGRSKNLKNRIKSYLLPGDRKTALRVAQMAERYGMEVAWRLDDSPSHGELLLLRQYWSDHDELPPLNHSRPWKCLVGVQDKIATTDSVDVT